MATPRDPARTPARGASAKANPASRANGTVVKPARPAPPAKGGANGATADPAMAEVLAALEAMRAGDFTVRLPTRRTGLAGDVARAFNAVAERNGKLHGELTRVARVVGREGRMSERVNAAAPGAWAEGVAAVNNLIDDLVRPTTEVARVLEAVARGDLSQKMVLTIEGRPVRGEFQRIGTVVNTMVDQLGSFADEVTRVAREVGTEGKLGGQAKVRGVSGTWKALTDNVNELADNLTNQVRNIAQVTTAVARGDLTQKITVDAKGEILELKNTLNAMVEQLGSFADEVTRVAREVGTEGQLGGQAHVRGVAGTWKDLTDNVNFMASNLTTQVRNIAQVSAAMARGDLTKRVTVEAKGEVAALAETINSTTDTLRLFAEQVTAVAREVGTEGKLGGQAEVPGVAGTWKDLTDSVNNMAGNLTTQVRNIAQVTTAVARGDLTQRVTVEAKGEVAALADTINSMTDTLRAFADEVTRVAREVGTEGQLGGQADVPGASGTWKDLTDNVNQLADNLTNQVRNIAQVTTAVAQGDLTQKITVNARGEILELKSTVNTMVDTLSGFADEVTRVAREVGTEGKLGGQAQVRGVAGTWKDLTDNVNQLADNLTGQVRNIAQVTTAVAKGDLTQKITVEARGEVAELKETVNTMVDQLSAFADEVTRVAREVGIEGRLGGQAVVKGVSGTWKELTDNVNQLADNLTLQVRDIAQVTTAVANGDLSQKISVDVRGELLELKRTVNTMVDQLSAFAGEVTRVAREVGTEGRLGGQAQVPGVSGTWKDLTDNVNQLADNLTGQVRNIAQVTTAVAKGDLSQKITVEARGEVAELKDTLNTMVDQLSAFALEVTRVARDVGTEGRLGGQAQVPGVSGTWKDLTDNVNLLADNLTDQVRNIAQVTTAVANGDLSQKITVEARGEILELKNTVNTMVDQLSAFADEVTRVAREVGIEGRLGGQADVPGISGTWKALTMNVNELADNLTNQVRNIAQVTTAVAKGDLSQKITVEARGEVLELKNTLNTMVDQLSGFAGEVTRVAREVGIEGRLGGQAQVPGVSGTWKDLTDNVNLLADNLTNQVRNIAQVTTAVAKGDLTQKITVDVRGEILELKNTLNTMVDQLGSFADEVTRVAREVGTEGNLGGQAEVKGVSGTWKDLTDSVNSMADNLTDQVRNIAQVTTAVATGDLSQKITVDARGEILELKNTINTMVDQLSAFAAEVTRVAREVGSEGQLGGQAEVEGVSGTWRRLTESVNLLAGNLTTQVRAIAEVSGAVTQGDLTRSITVEAAGEVGELKDTINQMIANLRETTQLTQDQDWLKTNLARISSMLQGHRDLKTVSQLLISELAPLVNAQHGAFFMSDENGDETEYRLLSSYGFKRRKGVVNTYKPGESLVGQAVIEKKPILVSDAPEDYIRIASGLGEAAPVNVIVLPVIFEDSVLSIIELASFRPFSEIHQSFLEQIVETVGVVLSTIIATMRTEELLKESQRLTEELQSQSEELQSQQDELRRSNLELEEQAQSLKASEELLQTQQEELQQTNAELEEKAAQLAEQNQAIEVKNTEIELARRALEERAEQLSLSSRYKSEFLANMSHELRTPLNSLLILARLLGENHDGNLSEKQVEFAKSIHGAGTDLLNLISDILDLSKVEAGKMEVSTGEVALTRLSGTVQQMFRPLTDQKGLDLEVEVEDDVPPSIVTDEQRLVQVLNNLLGNAVKFTESGGVTLRIRRAGNATGDRFSGNRLREAEGVVAFEVTDTGIGIAEDKLMLIFEPFQQADGTTSRKYGGTGLGLSISREIARLLGGELQVRSRPDEGSTFTLFIPEAHDAADPPITPREGDAAAAAEAWLEVPAPHDGVSLGNDGTALASSEEADLPDDRDALSEGDRVLLLVGSDLDLLEQAAAAGRERGFRILIAGRGDSALAVAREYRPDAIVLDTQLPGVDGLAVLEELKRLNETRHIPVHIISSTGQRQSALSSGAIAYLEKPVSPTDIGDALARLVRFLDAPVRRLLVVEDDERERTSIVELIGGGDADLVIVGVGSSDEAIAALEASPFDCMVLDLKLPKTSGFSLLEHVKGDERWAEMPVIVYTGKELSRREETRLKKYAETIIVKDVRSPERLLDETALFLHRVEARMPPEKRRMIEQLHSADAVFEEKKILIVDDDVRNVFALTSAFEGRGMEVLFAENGREGIDMLLQHPEVDLVLMDIMMPEMDGYETMRAIRLQEEFRRLPIIALTAKAMKGDREQSIAAGASDYITKPVDIDQLLSLMRVWLYK
ncbi:MAG TPA: HAMP domain-containing protein [Acidimicrobiales bacterium]|nr:HAMP domain-containing protein [Acidimicrobiales bacterium]